MIQKDIPTLSFGFCRYTQVLTTATCAHTNMCTHIYTICINLPLKPFLKFCVSKREYAHYDAQVEVTGKLWVPPCLRQGHFVIFLLCPPGIHLPSAHGSTAIIHICNSCPAFSWVLAIQTQVLDACMASTFSP